VGILPTEEASAGAEASFLYNGAMTLQVVVHKEPTGGFWAEVPALPGCASQGDTIEELKANVREAIEGWLDVRPEKPADAEIYEIAV
jgi:predicted RNase H-like HicB family nuclease